MQSATPAGAEAAKAQEEALAAKEAELAKAKEALAAAEHRAAVLKGKYDAEVPTLSAEKKRLEEQLRQLTEQAEKKIKASPVDSLDEGERELLGDPMIAANSKIAQEIAERAVQAALKPINERLNQFQQMSEAAYFATLDAALPADWERTLNNDPKLIAWLNEVDPGTKQLRGALLKRAEQGLQGHRVVEILTAFLEGREIGVREAPAPKSPPVSPPAGSGSQVPNAEPAKKTFSRREIAEFYRNKRTDPQYQGDEGQKRARAKEVEFHAAMREGRVTA